ncbi:hypothetical protein HY489_01775 [Candidatus Woesearchaeota archaeon]|nr:hypothetical protein [Candidatus Woesearchaeota archaeon]
MKKLLALFVVFLLACTPGLPPPPPVPGQTGGGYGHAVAMPGYADPSNRLLVSPAEIAIPSGQSGKIEVSVKQDFVYKSGYVMRNGQWSLVDFEGERVPNTDWLRSGKAVLTLSSSELREGDNFVIAYGCSQIAGGWDCNGNKWMIQTFKMTKAVVPPLPGVPGAVQPAQAVQPVVGKAVEIVSQGVASAGMGMKDYSFQPQSVQLREGEILSVQNLDGVTHSMKHDLFDTGGIAPFTTVLIRFNRQGVYSVHDAVRPDMKAQIIVLPPEKKAEVAVEPTITEVVKCTFKNNLGSIVHGVLEAGGSGVHYYFGGKDYKVELLAISKTASGGIVKFRVNGEITKEIVIGEAAVLADGTKIQVIGIGISIDALKSNVVFSLWGNAQECSSAKGKCSGTDGCSVGVSGASGEKVEWESTCGGYATQVVDGKDDVVEFDCAAECVDSDGGRAYDSVGKVMYKSGDSNTDVCVDASGKVVESGKQLVEYSCEGSGKEVYTCPYGCQGGACLAVPSEACTDSDGYDIYKPGTVRGLEAPGVFDTWNDYCGVSSEESGKLVEYTCAENNYGKKNLVACSNGCQGGACLKTPQCVSNQGQACNRNQCGGSGIVQCDGSCSVPAPNVPSNIGQACNRNQCGGNGVVQCDGSCSAPAPSVPSNYGQACGCGGTVQCTGQCSGQECPFGYVCRNSVCLPEKMLLSTQSVSYASPIIGTYSGCQWPETTCIGSMIDPSINGVVAYKGYSNCQSNRAKFKATFTCPVGNAENARFVCGVMSVFTPSGGAPYGTVYSTAYAGSSVTVECTKAPAGGLDIPCFGQNWMSGRIDCYKYN